MPISPTSEGFRAAFRRPAFTLGEITWRWVVGATATALFFFGLFEFLGTLPVTDIDVFLLRTRQPYLVAQAIAHIFRGSLSRGVISLMTAALLMSVLWMIAASLGRIATVNAMMEYFRVSFAAMAASSKPIEHDLASVSTNSPFLSLLRLNFLRIAVGVAGIVGILGAAILAGFASPDKHPRPGLAFLLFVPMAGLVWFAGSSLNWVLSLAGMFAVRDREDAVGAITSAVALCRERMGAVAAVSTWTGLAHLVAFFGASSVVAMPLGLSGVLPWRLVVLGMLVITLAYFVIADWLYTARLAGYVCIVEMPEELPMPLPPPVVPPPTATIDRDELILSDVPNAFGEA